MSHNNPPVRNAVIAALDENGPMTMREIAECLGWELERVHSVITGARKNHPGKYFRVVAYRRPQGKGKDSSVYAARPGPDLKRPPVDKKQRALQSQERYRKRNQAAINARLRIYNAHKRGRRIAVNPWAQLAPKEIAGAMAIVAMGTQA